MAPRVHQWCWQYSCGHWWSHRGMVAASHLYLLTLIVFTFPFTDPTGTQKMQCHPMLPILLTLWQDWIAWLILSRGIKLMKFKQIMRSMRLHRSYYRVQSFTYIVTHTLHSRFNGFAMTKGKLLWIGLCGGYEPERKNHNISCIHHHRVYPEYTVCEPYLCNSTSVYQWYGM